MSENIWSGLDEKPNYPGYYWVVSYRKRDGDMGIIRVEQGEGELICLFYGDSRRIPLTQVNGYFWSHVEWWPLRLPAKELDPGAWTMEKEYGVNNEM